MEIKQNLYNFLRKTQKYTGTDNVYLFKGGFWLTLGQFISTAASFLLAVSFANLLNPTIYGNYKYILSLTGILGIFTLTGMGTAITQAVARNLEGSFYKGFKTKLCWGILGSITAIILAVYYYLKGNYVLPIPLLVSAVFLPLMEASKVYSSFFIGRKLFKIQVKYSSLIRVISAGILIIALFILHFLNFQTKTVIFVLIAVYFASNTILNLSFYLITKYKFKPNKKEDTQTLSYGKHLSLLNVIKIITGYLDRILVFHYLGAVELAVYSFAIAVPEQIRGLLSIVQTLALPKFAARPSKEIKTTLFKKLIKFSCFIALGVIAYIFLAPYLYKFFFPQYLKSVPYSQLYSVCLILSGLTGIESALLKAKQATKYIYILSLINGALSIFLIFLFLYFWGIFGLIIARIIIKVIEFSLLNFIVVKKI